MSMIYDIRSSEPRAYAPEHPQLQSFFIGLYHPSRSNLVNTTSFAADREAYDFEGNLPSAVLDNIRFILDEDDDTFPPKKQVSTTTRTRFTGPKRLNPLAQIFVPGMRNGAGNSTPERLAAIDAVDRYRQRYYKRPFPSHFHAPGPKYPHDWRYMVDLAAHTPPIHMSSIHDHGREIVHSRLWSSSDMVELIRHICWKGAEPSFNTHPLSVALLAFSVHCHFKNCGDQKNASLFAGVIRECVLGYFKGLWDAENAESALRFTPNASYVPEYIQNLVLQCLWILVHQLTAPDHLNAIYDLILCSGVYGRDNGLSAGGDMVPLPLTNDHLAMAWALLGMPCALWLIKSSVSLLHKVAAACRTKKTFKELPVAKYCSQQCQAAHFATHKLSCPLYARANCFIIHASDSENIASCIEPFNLLNYGHESGETAELRSRLGWEDVGEAGKAYDHKGSSSWYYFVYAPFSENQPEQTLNKWGNYLTYGPHTCDIAIVRSGPSDASYPKDIIKNDLVKTIKFYQDGHDRRQVFAEREKNRFSRKMGIDLSMVPGFSL
ncbi:hypothetical protein BT96DRAFT_979683 [Gymnopus androsaceus JB14]|uniref:MYND-type domain-containing protein n=1 Tax=Gymnopus androsaceus JB14 TaxID=1447944 RepID=A0A6A4H2A3_9AGAR|nr:hypothetical protein BT96DRAFT_979683 [Gymnopus androsaceus JB14]